MDDKPTFISRDGILVSVLLWYIYLHQAGAESADTNLHQVGAEIEFRQQAVDGKKQQLAGQINVTEKGQQVAYRLERQLS